MTTKTHAFGRVLGTSFLMLALVAMSFPVSVRAEGEEGSTTPVVEQPAPEAPAPDPVQCDPGFHLVGDNCVADEAPAPALECPDGQVLNEAGDACDPEPAPEVLGARFANIVDEPQDNPYEDTTEDDTCVVVSDTLTTEGGNAAVLVSNPNSAWTAVVDSLSKWIWGEDPTTLAAGDEVETFTRTFSVDDHPTGATLRIAADNGYSVTVNGHAVGADSEEFNYKAGHEETYAIPAGNLLEGENSIVFVVTNKDLSGETPSSNPAGLRYKLTVNGADCGKPYVPENSCLAPSAEGATEEITVNSAPGSEDDLADLIGASDVQDDQVNFQTWDATGNDVDFVVTYHGKKANSGHVHVWGWLNGSTFTPIFRDATTGNLTYDALPLLDADGEQTTFSVTGVTDISFGILDTSSGKYYSTDKANSLNGDSADHAVVFNPNDDEYIIGYEDLANGGDHDFEDVVVGLATECSPTDDTATIVATKIVCSDERYLPDAMGSSHVTDEDTAAEFLAEVNEDRESPVCWPASGWQFEWGDENAQDPGGDFVGHADGYTTSGVTGTDGTVTMSVPLGDLSEIRVRELLKDGYIPFTYDEQNTSNEDTVSAEISCSNDGLNYDNFDFIRNPEEGESYHCVAWNVAKPKLPTCDPKVNLVANGSFENPDVTNGAGWDAFPTGTSGLVWAADFLGAALGGNVEIHGGVNGWLASDGVQYTELDSDINGPSAPGGQSAVEISQNLTTVSGQKYHVSYDFSARPGTAAVENSVSVSINGSPMHITSAAVPTAGNQTEWSTDGFDFTASGVSTVLALRDAGLTNDSLGTFVDNVKVTCVPDENGGGDEEVTDVCPNIDGFQSEIPDGKKIRDGQCVSSKNRSGGGSGSTGGQVLGASTCSPLLNTYLHIGWKNDPAEVSKLQDFLNTDLGLTLPVSGIFDAATEDAVKAFQKKHWELVLKPWIGLPASGISGEDTPTGFVYQTTRWQINNLFCPGSEAFPSTLN